jgi:S1-C subfamily serine protease
MSGAQQDSKILRIAFGVVETLGLLLGLPLALLSLMTLTVPFIENIWAQAVLASLVGIGVPLLIADRVLPQGQEATRWAGVPTDVFAISWMLIAFVVMGVGGQVTGQYLHREADLLTQSALAPAGMFVRWAAGPKPESADASQQQLAARTEMRADAGTGRPTADATSQADTDVGTDAVGRDATPTDAPVTAAPSEALSPAEVFKRAAPGVVSIGIKKEVRDKMRQSSGGTGFFIDDKGTLVTNFHVIDDADGATIKLKDGRETTDVDVLAVNKKVDIALLRIDPDELEGGDEEDSDDITSLPMGDSDDVVTGEQVVAIGNPLGLEYTLTDGIVSARRVWRDRKMIQISVPISPGNSGGPLLEMHGKVMGIATATVGSPWQRAQNLNLAVPINKVKPLYDGSYPNRHELGKSSPNNGTW